MIGGIIVALLGAASIIVAMFAESFGAKQEQAAQIKKVGWILGILLLLGGAGWIAVQLYRKGSDETQETLTGQTAYQIAQNEGNPSVIAANAAAYNSCYNNCVNQSTWTQRKIYPKRTAERCAGNCK